MPDTFDTAVIGAGPAGTLAARVCAQSGLRTILLDRAAFPRQKVCGGCLSASGVALLKAQGLASTLDRVSISGMNKLSLHTPHARAALHVMPGRIIDRRSFDLALVEEANRGGAEFRDRTRVTSIEQSDEGVTIGIRSSDHSTSVLHARTVLNATGLTNLAGPTRPAKNAYIGVSAHVRDDSSEFEPAITHMHVARHGYAGIVRLNPNTLNIACALNPRATREHGVHRVVEQLLASTGTPILPGLACVNWIGTPPLTHRRHSARGRVLNLGDSAGYVEPFTGEGMTWAIASAIEASALVTRWINAPSFDLASAYTRAHKRAVARRWRACHTLRLALRSPLLLDTAVRLASLSSTFTTLARAPFERPYTIAEPTP